MLADACLLLSDSVMDWEAIQGVPCLLFSNNWGSLQIHDPEERESHVGDEWVNWYVCKFADFVL